MTTDDSRDFEDADTLSPVPKSDQRDDSREQAIEQAAKTLDAAMDAHDGIETLPWEGRPMEDRNYLRSLARALADAGLLAGTASTTEAEDKEYLDALDVIGRLRAEVREVRAEVDAYSAARVIELEADLAALRDKVRALHSHESDDEGIRCCECWNAYPCDTIALLTDGGQS